MINSAAQSFALSRPKAAHLAVFRSDIDWELDDGDTSDDESPSFAPNGRLIIYASRAQGRDVLMTTTLDGKIRARLVSTSADVREPVWGPFGR
jgi:Tol biopolymer transport system component